MALKKIEDRDRGKFYFACERCNYESAEKKKTRENMDEQPPAFCPKCGKP